MADAVATAAETSQPAASPPAWKALLRWDWARAGGVILDLAGLWVAGIFVLQVFSQLSVITVLGTLHAGLLGLWLGAFDAQAEEFALTLPPNRDTRCRVRLGLAVGAGGAPVLVAVLAHAFELPQALWGLLVSSGFTAPYPHPEAPLAVAIPVLAAAVAAVCGALAGLLWRRDGGAGGAYGMLAGLVAVLILAPMPLPAWLRVVVLLVATVGLPPLGLRWYRHKEIATAPPAGAAASRSVKILVVAFFILLLLLLLSSLVGLGIFGATVPDTQPEPSVPSERGTASESAPIEAREGPPPQPAKPEGGRP